MNAPDDVERSLVDRLYNIMKSTLLHDQFLRFGLARPADLQRVGSRVFTQPKVDLVCILSAPVTGTQLPIAEHLTFSSI